MEGHLRDKCPLILVDCPFNYTGCEAQLPRKDIHEHMKETIHLTLLATVTQRLSIEKRIRSYNRISKNLRGESISIKKVYIQKQLITEKEMISIALKKEWQEKEQQSQEHLHKQRIADDEIRALKEESQKLIKAKFSAANKHLRMAVRVSCQVQQRYRVYSPAFHTYPHGYRMCVYVDPEGVGAGAGSHVSISTCLMCGRFNDYLNWPFREC